MHIILTCPQCGSEDFSKCEAENGDWKEVLTCATCGKKTIMKKLQYIIRVG